MAESETGRTNPRHLAKLGLFAMAHYKEAGMVRPGDYLHKQMVARLARIATKDDGE